ncbi:unnamed protein product [Prorocentrum cordatum]|uniref:Uncharacterized protein n=1 Tax=Prorocentrum cordatum TaxID=2364126 RepID=A0ABN9UNI9_9DINO|nr:unnamed protein product [Polarella glacialis]
MTGAADARDAGACSPPRRDGAPSAVSTGDQSAATAAQADAWRAKLAEELGEWSWPERCLGRGYCIEVLVTEDGSTDAAQGRWVDAVPQQRVVDEAGRDAYLCAEYEWDSDPTPTGRTSGPRESDPRGPCTPSTSSCGGSARENEAGRSRSRGPSPWLRPTSCCRRRPCWVAALCMTGRKGTLLSLQDVLCNCFFSNRDCGNMQRWSNVRP